MAVRTSDGDTPSRAEEALTASTREPIDVEPHVYRHGYSDALPVVDRPRSGKLVRLRFRDPRGGHRLRRDVSQRGGVRAWSSLVSRFAACASTAAALSTRSTKLPK